MARHTLTIFARGRSKKSPAPVKRAGAGWGRASQVTDYVRGRRKATRSLIVGIDRKPRLVLAGIYSKRFEALIEKELKRLTQIMPQRVRPFLARIELAKIVCTRTRVTEEAAFGKDYYSQRLACQRLVDLAGKIIFSPDESIREYYRKRLETTRLPTSYNFTPHRVP